MVFLLLLPLVVFVAGLAVHVWRRARTGMGQRLMSTERRGWTKWLFYTFLVLVSLVSVWPETASEIAERWLSVSKGLFITLYYLAGTVVAIVFLARELRLLRREQAERRAMRGEAP